MLGTQTPHVSFPIRFLEREGPSNQAETTKIVEQLVQILTDISAATKREGLLTPGDADEFGRLLAPTEAAPPHLAQLLNAMICPFAASKLSMRCTRKTNKRCTVEELEQLPAKRRRLAIPIEGTREVALPLEHNERGMARITLKFPDGAVATVVEQADAHAISILCCSAKKENRGLNATLPSGEQAERAVALFASIGLDGLPAAPPAPTPGASRAAWLSAARDDTPEKVLLKKACGVKNFHRLPRYASEAFAVLLQDYFRAHCLLSTGMISRGVYVDTTVVQQQHDGSHVLRSKLHPASGPCLCPVHSLHTDPNTFRFLEFRVSFCGATAPPHTPDVLQRCPRCKRQLTSKSDPVCTQELTCKFNCVHAFDPSPDPSKPRARALQLPLPAHGDVRACIAALAVGALALARGAESENEAALRKAEAEFHDTASNLHATLKQLGLQSTPKILSADAIARALLRAGVRCQKDGKTLQSPREYAADARAIAKTHKQLFRRMRV